MSTLLQNLPPKLKASIEEWLKTHSEDEFAFYFLSKNGICISLSIEGGIGLSSLPEPAVIGLLTAWLESEGWLIEVKYITTVCCKVYIYKNDFKEPPITSMEQGETPLPRSFNTAFWQAFEKVVKIMEEQE